MDSNDARGDELKERFRPKLEELAELVREAEAAGYDARVSQRYFKPDNADEWRISFELMLSRRVRAAAGTA